MPLLDHCTALISRNEVITAGGFTFGSQCIPGLPCRVQTAVFSYNRDANTWHREPDMPSPRRFSSCVTTKYMQRDVVLVSGGADSAGFYVVEPDLIAFDLRQRTWSVIVSNSIAVPPHLRNSVISVVGRELYFVGGMEVKETYIHAAWRNIGVFDLDSGSWQIRSELDVSVNLNSLYSFWYSFDVIVAK